MNVLEKWVNSFYEGYNDPDGIRKDENTYSYNNKDFYIQTMKILESRNSKFEVKMEANKPGLVMKNVETGKTFCLKSDQFGFSAPSIKLNHAYDVYLLKTENQNLNGAIEKVIAWVKKTREVGGSFFWPMELNDNGNYNLNPRINIERGGTKFKCKGSYIEDRVDLTLLEIKEVYDCGILKDNDAEIPKGNILLSKCFTSTMKEFLSEFDSFKEYVNFFGFNSFVEDKTKVPYNILKTPLAVLDGNIERIGILYNETMEASNYEIIFDNLDSMIKKRQRELGYLAS